MPTFLIIGAGKSGTTSVYHYLRQHPEVYMPRIKEPLFFAFEGERVNFTGPGDAEINARAVTTLDSYRTLFAEGAGRRAMGEASVAYLYYPKAAERIRKYQPEAKLVLLLRCPAERAYANFLHALRLGREPITNFARALKLEPERISARWSHFYHYASKGWYYRQISVWLRLFPREQFLFNLYDDLEDDPVNLMRRIFQFIGVDPAYPINVDQRFNVSGHPRSIQFRNVLGRSSFLRKLLPHQLRAGMRNVILNSNFTQAYMPADVRRSLMEEYAPDIDRLAELIDRDLSVWHHQRRQRF